MQHFWIKYRFKLPNMYNFSNSSQPLNFNGFTLAFVMLKRSFIVWYLFRFTFSTYCIYCLIHFKFAMKTARYNNKRSKVFGISQLKADVAMLNHFELVDSGVMTTSLLKRCKYKLSTQIIYVYFKTRWLENNNNWQFLSVSAIFAYFMRRLQPKDARDAYLILTKERMIFSKNHVHIRRFMSLRILPLKLSLNWNKLVSQIGTRNQKSLWLQAFQAKAYQR